MKFLIRASSTLLEDFGEYPERGYPLSAQNLAKWSYSPT
jgi:hypothetical protein